MYTRIQRLLVSLAPIWLVLLSYSFTYGQQIPGSYLRAMEWRSIGPARGGRSVACAGIPGDQMTYYFGATGGGLWKTTDGGVNWRAVTDSFLTSSSVGAVAVAPSDPNVLYIGTGERDIRGNISPGDGLYKSTDAGKTWAHIGLKEVSFVGRIVVHPTNPDVVWVAALGRVFGNSKERGVYKSTDGGKTWKKALYVDEKTGAVHLAIDPSNPRILYAAMWECFRNPWSMSSGGPGSGLYKSTDGGETWTNISQRPGLPKGALGKIGVAVSPVNPNRVWAIIENENGGGLFLSLDGGDTWQRTTADRNLRQRAWYYTHVIADTRQEDVVYVLNVNFHKSVDGGKTFSRIETPHGDHHDLWIAPENNQRMVIADDGGASVSLNGGEVWTDLDIPTAQLYHVTLDNRFPYRVYGAQQDNSTISGPSRTTGYNIPFSEWYPVAGGESGYIAVDPRNPEITYGGSYSGYLTRYDRRTDQNRLITPYPNNPMGSGAGANKYRFQWTFPIVFSPHDPKTLYCTAQVVFRTRNEGQTWEAISPDLSRNDSTKLGSSGGPITQDNTGVEYYGTVFAFAESPVKAGVLWAGTDDGRVHVSQDNGATWQDVTPKDIPEWALMSILEPSNAEAGTCYLAATRYKLDDFRPYLYKTTDYGLTWTKIVTGIPAHHFTHVVREDPNDPRILYAGTEYGVYFSLNRGVSWQSLQLNLPNTPIRDLAVHKREKDLVVATHGRSFWILDDLTPLHQLADGKPNAPIQLLAPRHAYRMDGGSYSAPGETGINPPNGVLIHYTLTEVPKDTLFIEILDAEGQVLRSFNNRETPKKKPVKEDPLFFEKPDQTPYGVVPTNVGLNRLVWDMRVEGPKELPGAILWFASLQGPKVVPGIYTIRLRMGETVQQQRVDIRLDPRLELQLADLQAQYDFIRKVGTQVTRTHEAIIRLRAVRDQLGVQIARLEGLAQDSLKTAADSLLQELDAIEDRLIQKKIQAGQDALNYPVRLNNKVASLMSFAATAEARPTDAMLAVFEELMAELEPQLLRLEALLATELPKLNALIAAVGPPAIKVE